MKPTTFEGQNKLLERPEGMTEAECATLPVLNTNGQCISCWKLSWRERLKVLWTGRVWLGVLFGPTQPPVYLAADRPFELAKEH